MACLLLVSMVLSENLTTVNDQDPDIGGAIVILAQIAVSLWIWSVWTWRINMSTNFRGQYSESLLSEFKTYGYSSLTYQIVGFVKCLSAFIVGPVCIAYPIGKFADLLLYGSAGTLLFLMVVAIGSHIYVKDGISKSIPAGTMATLCILIMAGQRNGCITVYNDGENLDHKFNANKDYHVVKNSDSVSEKGHESGSFMTSDGLVSDINLITSDMYRWVISGIVSLTIGLMWYNAYKNEAYTIK